SCFSESLMKMIELLKDSVSNVTALTIWFNSLFSSFAEFLQPVKNNNKDEIIYFILVFVKLPLMTAGFVAVSGRSPKAPHRNASKTAVGITSCECNDGFPTGHEHSTEKLPQLLFNGLSARL